MKPNDTNITNDIAVIFSENNRFVEVASFNRDGKLDVKTFPLENLHQNLLAWRESLGYGLDLQTSVRLAETFFTAQTQIASLSDEVVGLDDEQLTDWLLEAARKGKNGEDGFPLFPTELSVSCYDYARLDSGEITLTEIPRQIVNVGLKQAVGANIFNEREVTALTESLPDDIQPVFRHFVETRIRAVARYFLADWQSSGKLAEYADENIVFLAFSPNGATFALWNAKQNFYFELGEVLHLDYDLSEIPEGMLEADYADTVYDGQVERFLNEQVYPRIFPEGGEFAVVRVICAADENVMRVQGLVKSFCDSVKLPFTVNQIPLGTATVQGLLLAENVSAAALVAPVNLAFDLTRQAEAIEDDKLNENALAALRRRRMVVFAVFAPIIFAIALGFGLYFDTWRMSANFTAREKEANFQKERLTPILESVASAEKTFKWYEDMFRQIASLKKKQSAALSFASSLDAFYPTETDFYVSDIVLKPGGIFEIKGLTRNESSVSQFYRTMEFSEDENAVNPNPNLPSRKFQSLQLDFKQGSPFQNASLGTSGGGNLADGISAFVIRGQYAPMSVLKTASPNSPAVPNAPATSPAQNANANSSVPPVQTNPANGSNTNQGGQK